MNLDDFEMWLYSQDYSSSTIRQRVSLLRLMEADGLDIDNTEDLDIARYLYQRELPYGAKNNRVKAINLYLKFLGRDFRLKQTYKRGTKDFWIPTAEEKDRLLSVTMKNRFQTVRMRLILKILFEAGLRAAELCALKEDSLKRKRFKQQNGEVCDFWCLDVVGKGSKKRYVPVSDELAAEIMEYARYYGAEKSLFGIRTPMLGKLCREAREIAGVAKFHPHSARHYYAVELYQSGVSLEAIREMLGHTSLATTQIYLQGSKGFVFFEFRRFQEVKHEKGK